MPALEVVKEVMDANSVTSVINNLNTLYSSVLTYTAILIGLVGILIPALSVLFQWRSLNAEKKNLEQHIQDGLNNAKESIRNDLLGDIRKQFDIEEKSLFSRMEKKVIELEKQLECAVAATFYLQGSANLDKNLFGLATIDYCTSAVGDFKGDGDLNAQRALQIIIDNCIPNLSKQDFENSDVEDSINKLVSYLEQKDVNINKRHSDNIQRIKMLMNDARKRE